MSKYITIITPTYNRAYCLPKLLESLKRQTNKNFIWFLIDDGSTDNTEAVVSNWKISEFSFYYMKQENGGKHRALNKVVPLVETKYTFIVDSDDYLLDNAIENIEKWIKTIEDNKDIAAVSGLRIYPNGQRMSGFPKGAKENSFIIASNFERWKKGLTGDQAEVYRTDLLKKYPFPEFEGEKFISESAVFNKIAIEKYKVKWINTPIYVCEYLSDGLTKHMEEIELENYQGFTYTRKMSISNTRGWFRTKNIAKYVKISRKKGMTLEDIATSLNISNKSVVIGYFIQLLYSLAWGLKK